VNPAATRPRIRNIWRALPGALLAAVALAAVVAPVARALPPPKPALTGTNPPSPATSTTPFIQGRADGIVTARPNPRGRVVFRGSTSTVTISIYTNPGCSGVPVATGSGDELEGTGIQVTVGPDSTTTFYADATDAASSTSPCSSPGLTYQQVTSGPAPPVPASVSPASPANENQPRVSGSAATGSTVRIYSNPSCSGASLASGTSAAFAGAGIQVPVADDSTTTFYASASLAGISSTCSATFVTYREDSTGPRAPDLKVLPGSRANDNDPRVSGSAPGATTVKIYDNANCNGPPLATGTPADLNAGFPVEVAENSTSSFFGIAIDNVGNSSSCSDAPAVYTEDSIPPHTRITLGPGAKTRNRSPIFRFTDVTGNPGTTFLCRLDRGKWRSCRTPRHYRRLHRGRHTVRVKAVDAAGNRELVGTKRRFRVIGKARDRHR
jgi:hypothetical protein